MKKTAIVLCLWLALNPGLLHAIDYGLIVDQGIGYGGIADDVGADYTIALVPRFSALLGDAGDIYVSAGFVLECEKDAITFVPELLRTEFSWAFGLGDLKAGRMYYADPLGFIANGLFDGARFSLSTELGTFSAGAWYTGLQYKRRANIAMTQKEIKAYALPLDARTYLAPSRIAAALEWEHMSLGGPFQVWAALFGQFDAGGGGDRLHSQYLTGKAALPLRTLTLNLGACLELIQNAGTFGTAAAAEFGLQAELPATPLLDRLSFVVRHSSGVGKNAALAAFLPLTTVAQGEVLEAKLSGVSLVSLDYATQIFPAFSGGVSSTYFIRGDTKTFAAYPVNAGGESGGYLLGNEFFVRLMWNPFSDLQVNLGGGVFLPSMGNAAPDAGAAWRVELNVVFGL